MVAFFPVNAVRSLARSVASNIRYWSDVDAGIRKRVLRWKIIGLVILGEQHVTDGNPLPPSNNRPLSARH
jgi:hypothetical protein